MIARLCRTGFARSVVLGFAAVALVGIAQPASAQMGGMGGFGDMMAPEFNRRDIVLMVDGLRLDETQKLILETLYDSYEQDFRDKADEFRDRMSALREEAMPSEEREARMREARQRFESVRDEIRAKRQALEEEYGEDLPEEVEEKFREEVRAQFTAVRNEMREQGRNWFQDQTAQDMFGKLAPLSEEWTRVRNQLRDEFIADLHMQLSEEQAPLWPGVERMIRRSKSLQRGRISGESADLFQIARSMNLSAEQQSTIQPILNQYEVELDAALKQRDEYLASSWADLLRAMQTMDTEDGIAVIEKQTKLRTQVRDINDRFALNIEQALDEAAGPKFRAEFLARAYPRVFEPTRMERVLTAAEALEGLEPSIAEAISEMKASYLAEVNGQNESLLSKVRKHEPEEAVRMAKRMAARMTNQELADETNPLEEAMEARQQIGERYRDQLTQLLTEEQVAMLPLGRGDRRGGGRFGEGGRGGDWGGGDWRRGDDDDDRRPGADRPRRPRGDRPEPSASDEPD